MLDFSTGQVVNEIEALVLKYNSVAMDYLRLENFKDSLTLLKKAEEVLNSDENEVIPNRLKLMGITLNNLGCYYKKRRQPKVALTFLEKALEVELQTDADNINLAGSHLNICAVLSSLSKHKEAFNHANQALILLENVHNNDNYSFDKTVTLITSLVISYFNAGAELEFMSKYSEAIEYYKNGYEISRKELGNKHQLTSNIAKALKIVNSKVKAGERLSKSNIRDIKTPIKYVESVKPNRFPSVTRGKPVENKLKFQSRLLSAYDRLRAMSFQAPL